jgi:hypothetical protein
MQPRPHGDMKSAGPKPRRSVMIHVTDNPCLPG